MKEGWNAQGLLQPLWGRVGGRDRLAELADITPATLSGYNTGRLPLGLRNARKIADALDVTLADLGAPEEAVGGPPQPLHLRLQELEATCAAMQKTIRHLRESVDLLLAERAQGAAQPLRAAAARSREARK